MEKLRKHKNLIKAFFMSLLPLLAGVLLCAADGKSLQQVSLITSEWNDELFYYKQVESILNFGFPQGYFGFNESHAQYLSFAAWSPVLVFPWILWGLIFGWNLMSPIYCNLFLMMLTMFLFVLLVKPNKKQTGILAVLYFCHFFLTRYMLSAMPEIICSSMAVIFLALCYYYEEHKKTVVLGILFAMVFLMTLMRPYLLLFILFPSYHCIRKYRIKGIIWPVLTVAASFIVYALINHYFSAKYFTPLFKTEWLTKWKDAGFISGLKFTVIEVWWQIKELIVKLKEGFFAGIPAGVLYIEFLFVSAILGIQVVLDLRKKEKKSVNCFLLLCCLGIFAAIILMYKIIEGSRHLVIFITMAVFAISMMETRFYKKAALTAAVFFFFYQQIPESLYFYEIPYQTEQKQTDYAYWEEKFENNICLNEINTPNFDNVIIWTLNDVVDKQEVLTEWQMLYAVPEGFGISCCKSNYVMEHFDELKSRYIATIPGGKIDDKCVSEKKKLVGKSNGIVIYELR